MQHDPATQTCANGGTFKMYHVVTNLSKSELHVNFLKPLFWTIPGSCCYRCRCQEVAIKPEKVSWNNGNPKRALHQRAYERTFAGWILF